MTYLKKEEPSELEMLAIKRVVHTSRQILGMASLMSHGSKSAENGDESDTSLDIMTSMIGCMAILADSLVKPDAPREAREHLVKHLSELSADCLKHMLLDCRDHPELFKNGPSKAAH